LGTAKRASGRVKVDVMRHHVRLGVDQRHLDIVALVDNQRGAGHGAIEGHGLHGRPFIVDDDLLLFDGHREFNDARLFAGRCLRMGMHHGWCDEINLYTLEIIDRGREGGDSAHHSGENGGENGWTERLHGCSLWLSTTSCVWLHLTASVFALLCATTNFSNDFQG